MATDDSDAGAPEDLSPEEAREHLMRLIAAGDLEEHEDIYEALARE